MTKIVLIALSSFFFLGCSSTTEEGAVGVERKQLMLVSSEEMIEMSVQGYETVKKEAAAKGQLDQNKAMAQRVSAIAKRLIPMTATFRKDALEWPWETHVTTSDELNAWCMPGGKIMFYTALIEKLKLTDGEIAAVMGHEIAHALREHGRERMSQEMAKNVGLQLLIATGKVDAKYAAAINAVSMVTITLPHGRGQELEADEVGVELMARAGFNPEEALSLWKKMGQGGGAKPPAILSTHPSDTKRLETIESLLPKVMPLYRQTQK
jgi:predicted Zn-dependent protease